MKRQQAVTARAYFMEAIDAVVQYGGTPADCVRLFGEAMRIKLGDSAKAAARALIDRMMPI